MIKTKIVFISFPSHGYGTTVVRSSYSVILLNGDSPVSERIADIQQRYIAEIGDFWKGSRLRRESLNGSNC